MLFFRSLFTAILLSLVSLASHAAIPVVTFTMDPFDSLVLSGGHEYEIVQGNTFRVQVQGHDLSDPLVLQNDNTVALGRSRTSMSADHSFKYRVETPYLTRLDVSGSGRLFVRPFLSSEPLMLNVAGSSAAYLYDWNSSRITTRLSGSGTIEFAKLEAERMSVSIGGSGSIAVGEAQIQDLEASVAGSGEMVLVHEGTMVKNLTVNIAGSGGLEAEKSGFGTVVANIMGSGDVDLGPTERVLANIIGSGSVYYRGDAITESSVLGSGRLEQADD